jgi:hypothetical protein
MHVGIRLGLLLVAIAGLFVQPKYLAASEPASKDMLGREGDAILSRATKVSDPPVTTRVSDYFGTSPNAEIAVGGRRLLTAGKGSLWVYDPVHHIVAVSEYGDVNGNSVIYSEKPPANLPARNLSHVLSAHGLRLGMPAVAVAAILGVRPGVVRQTSATGSYLYARKPRMCGTRKCAHDAIVIFEHDRAVAISLDDIGP